ncbi:dihydrolipoamide acetyltransferase family protein [Parasphingorhabdus sp.]|uniref:dihydrolipoamide acetyltransferase family protein n=1 Tax=Parasphingorhabdus sp. TaxID=2709688 RepID=UPI003A8D2568
MGVFTMPSLGADMADGILVEWLKKAGETVTRGDIVAVVETEKGAIEIEIFESGTLDAILVEEGRKVPVGTPLATISGEGDTGVSQPSKVAPATTPLPERGDETTGMPVSPVVPKPVMTAAGTVVRASPAARIYARDNDIDLMEIAGTGPEGAIQLRDLEKRLRTGAPRGIDPDAMRHAIAAAMSRSKREIPHYYLTQRIDVSDATSWLEDYNRDRPPPDRILFGTLLVKAVVLAVRDFPEFNGLFEQDGFSHSAAVHAGIAITIRGGGLVAPAIQNADKMSLADLMVQMRDLVGRVRRGSFRASELTSSTITINSLGDRGVESVLPIIYPPQVAIVGFGKVMEQPWVVDGNIAVRPVIQMTLAADHRVSDGHRGGLFVNAIADRLASPEGL